MSASATKRDVLRFPVERTGHAVRDGATRLDIIKGRLRVWFGTALNKLGTPGAIAAADIYDHTTGQHVAVAVGAHFVRLTVNGRDFFFDRITGRYNGGGSAMV